MGLSWPGLYLFAYREGAGGSQMDDGRPENRKQNILFEGRLDFFERQSKETQEVGKLKFYYISALHRLEENKKAYEIMEGNGGLVIDDIREGEESVSRLWSELYEKLYGVKAPVPYKYDFKAS